MRVVLYRTLQAVVAFLLLTASSNAAEGSLDDAKKLYAAASFENSLATLAQIDVAASKSPEVLEYKALCLLALGRVAEAQSVVDTLVSTAPTFVPADDDGPPRFVAVLNDTRRRLLPEITKRLFKDARRSISGEESRPGQGTVRASDLRLTDDGVWRETDDAGDLRTLASGFLELLNSAPRIGDQSPSRAVDPGPDSRKFVSESGGTCRRTSENRTAATHRN